MSTHCVPPFNQFDILGGVAVVSPRMSHVDTKMRRVVVELDDEDAEALERLQRQLKLRRSDVLRLLIRERANATHPLQLVPMPP